MRDLFAGAAQIGIPAAGARWILLGLALLGLIAPWGCKRHPPLAVGPETLNADNESSPVGPPADSDAPPPAAAAPGTEPEIPEVAAAVEPVPPVVTPSAGVRQIGVSQLITLLKARKELRALTLDTAPAHFAGLVPTFTEKSRDDERWELEGVNDSGFVRSIILTFASTADDSWVLRSVSVRVHAEQPARTFQEIRRAANAVLKKPKWLDLNARDRTAWSLGGGWELVAAVLDDGDVHLHSGPAFAQ